MEALLGIFIVALLASTLLPTYLFANRQVSYGRRMDEATQIAASALEEWRTRGFDQLPDPADGNSSVSMPIANLGELPNPTGTITFTLVDEKLQPIADPDADRVLGTATVTWKDAGSSMKKVTITTLYSAN